MDDKSSMPSSGMRDAMGRTSWDGARIWNTSDPKKDAVWHLFIAVVLLEFVVAVVAMLSGIMNAGPSVAGGPPDIRFPWLAWSIGAVAAPAGLFLLLHLVSLISGRTPDGEAAADAPDAKLVPPRLQRFYACVRHAPTVVLLIAVLLLGAAMYFLGDFWNVVQSAGAVLTPYIPWFVGGIAGFLAAGYLGRLFFVFRHRQMEQEYAFRREVLERTGVVIVSKDSVPLAPAGQEMKALPEGGYQLSSGPALPPAGKNAGSPRKVQKTARADDIVDVDSSDIRPVKKNRA